MGSSAGSPTGPVNHDAYFPGSTGVVQPQNNPNRNGSLANAWNNPLMANGPHSLKDSGVSEVGNRGQLIPVYNGDPRTLENYKIPKGSTLA